jgi:hypothetical protein
MAFFRLTGQINGRSVEEELVTAHTLIQLFNIPLDTTKETALFQLDKQTRGVVGKDVEGNKRVGISRNVLCFVAGVYKGVSYEVRYYERRNRVNTNQSGGGYKYFPRKMRFSGSSMRVNLQHDLDKAVMYYLSSLCGDSPLKGRKGMSHYRLINEEQVAETQYIESKLFEQAYSLIDKESDTKLVRIAKGITIDGRPIPSGELRGVMQCKVALITRAKTNAKDIVDAFSDTYTYTRGLVVDCIEKGYILLKPGKTGSVWYWNAGSKSNQPICEAHKTQDAKSVLSSFVAEPKNYAAFMATLHEIEEAAKEKVVVFATTPNIDHKFEADEDIHPPIDFKDVESVLNACYDREVFTLDRVDNKVKLFNDQGGFGATVVVLDSPDDWMTSAAEKMTTKSPKFKQLVRILKEKLNKEG